MNTNLTPVSRVEMFRLSQWKLSKVFAMANLTLHAKVLNLFCSVKPSFCPKNASDFKIALKEAGIKATCWGEEILEKSLFTKSDQRNYSIDELDLVLVSPGDLGIKVPETDEEFKDMRLPLIEEVYRQAKELGLDVCPAWLVPLILLQYRDQVLKEFEVLEHGNLFVAVEPITSSYSNIQKRSYGVRIPKPDQNGDKSLFQIGLTSEKVPYIDAEHIKFACFKGNKFFFVRPKAS